MTDGQSKITSFFKRPTRIEKTLPNKEVISNGYKSDETEIYDYETELSDHISKLETESQKNHTKSKSSSRKSNKKFTLIQPKEFDRYFKKSYTKTSRSSDSKINFSTRRSTRLSFQLNSDLCLQQTKSNKSSENVDSNKITSVKLTHVRKQFLEQDVIIISCDGDENKSTREPIPELVHSKLWCERHRFNIVEDFLGDTSVLKSVKKWLSSWNEKFSKNNDEQNDIPREKSLFIHGPNGVGKTSLVYLIAKECGYKVIEYNSSIQKLSSSFLQKDLLESSQSHCIDTNKISSFFQTKTKKLISNDFQSQNASISKSLILFDDIDAILYEDKSDLWKTIRQTIRDARKPIIFTSMFDLSFLTSENDIFLTLQMKSLDFKTIQQRLSHILKAEHELNSNTIFDQLVLWKNISIHSGDIRQAINEIQFWSKKKELLETKPTLNHDELNIELHLNLLDLLSIEDCLNASQKSTIRNIDEYNIDYNLYNYHRTISLLSFHNNDQLISVQQNLIDCLHEADVYQRNYDRYSYDVRFFSN